MADDRKIHDGPFTLFQWIEHWEVKTRPIEYYTELVKDDQSYAEHLKRMEKFFTTEIDMFPYEPGAPWVEDGAYQGGPIPRLSRPRRFHEILEAESAERFPGGSGSVGDHDIRMLLRAFADMFQRNIMVFVAVKKLLLIVPAALLLALIFNPAFLDAKDCSLPLLETRLCGRGGGGWPALLAIAIGAALATLIVFAAANRLLALLYQNALRNTANVVNAQAMSRTQSLSNLFTKLMKQIDGRKTELNDANRKRWPKEAGRWMMIAYWVAGRLDFIERFVQIQMWRVRRAHYFINRTGYAATWIIAVSLLVAGLLLAWVNHKALPDLPMVKWVVMAIAGLTIAAMNYASYAVAGWRTPLDLVRSTLSTENWHRYGSLKIHEQLSNQLHSDKQLLVEADAAKHH
ncbi:hypothetical protein QO010_001980 [Caulobacter ginsengisoli]|uniref:SMODS and SLOG-associating 2TM effector domain-containing protein n=1 Tax=Caulobacter ginsengisoli TaxID=400775 RepID=A0ABU0IQA4_9CAUL|nr:hypothetical protein [Caulobacter ginsengisoli]MDQ0464199.1 hypothetical protein [Caulobacter ginsengisoli]